MNPLIGCLLLLAPDFAVETVATGLRVPWGLAFPEANRILVTERGGTVRVVRKGKLEPKPLHSFKEVVSTGEAGLMDIQLHPKFAENRWTYFSLTYREGPALCVRIVRFKDAGDKLIDRKIILDAIPTARFHAGCRLGFGPDGKLYITTGDGAAKANGQKLDTLMGKTLRLNDDGTIPLDNPFVGKKGVRPEIWSYGHRNAQGLAWQPGTELMFQTEHGPSIFDGPAGGDEFNLVTRGGNLGWALTSHGKPSKGTIQPLLIFTPAVAPAGAAFYTGDTLKWAKGNLFFGCLRGTALMRVVLDGPKVVKHETLRKGKYGRIREVAMGLDGHLYFTTSNRDGRARPGEEDDRILRLVPKGG
ncbi:MAG: PQQ-dependent sugar dehydrogenase [Planctomycetota bacterium]